MSKKLPNTLKAVMVDIGGTLVNGNIPTHHAIRALKRLRTVPDVHIKLVTNTVVDSSTEIYDRLMQIGFKIQPTEIYSSLTATAIYVKQMKLNPFYILSEELLKDFPTNDISKPYDAVVVGVAPAYCFYEYKNFAIDVLKLNKKNPLISIHSGIYYKKKYAMVIRMAKYFIIGLEKSVDTKCLVFGKPSKHFYMNAIPPDVSPEQCIMIGDNPYEDMKGAMDNGMFGFLVKTGKYTGHQQTLEPKPQKIFENFSEAVDWILKHTKK